MTFHIGPYFETLINWMKDHFASFFDGMAAVLESSIGLFEQLLKSAPPVVMIIVMAALAWWACGLKKWGLMVFTILGMSLVWLMELWGATMQTLALVLSSTLLALLIGVPLGIACGRSKRAEEILRPTLDFMQTMPAFVYLIPAVIFFSLGKVPGAVATVIFAMPPCVRLTTLGLRQVPKEMLEATNSFGATASQLLFKVQLPMALPSILAGVNQTIMLALSMVVIAAMIGAGGLGDVVLRGITQMRIGQGFEGGLAIVVLAMYLDRVTHALGSRSSRRKPE